MRSKSPRSRSSDRPCAARGPEAAARAARHERCQAHAREAASRGQGAGLSALEHPIREAAFDSPAIAGCLETAFGCHLGRGLRLWSLRQPAADAGGSSQNASARTPKRKRSHPSGHGRRLAGNATFRPRNQGRGTPRGAKRVAQKAAWLPPRRRPRPSRRAQKTQARCATSEVPPQPARRCATAPPAAAATLGRLRRLPIMGCASCLGGASRRKGRGTGRLHLRQGASMETEWYNRAETIAQRVTQLKDSL
jgi:hypothetical protein